MNLSAYEIEKATFGKLLCGDGNKIFHSISIDSRKMEENTLFIPIIGDNFDGHQFILSALNNGAVGFLTQQDVNIDNYDGFVIKVEDTKDALLKLASFYIDKMDVKTVGVTGSVGKTSTKDMIYSVLSQKAKTLKTEGNFNNHIGLPLTIFRLDETFKFAVLEMGMSGFSEIEKLSKVAKPSLAVITNIGYSHIEHLGSRENILKAKLEIASGMDKIKLIINADDDLLSKIEFDKISVGLYNSNCNYKANIIERTHLKTVFYVNGLEYSIHAMGEHNVLNALMAIAVGEYFSLTYEQIKKGLDEYRPYKMRQNIVHFKDVTYIEDCYNSSYDSIVAAVKVIEEMPGRKIAVLGGIAELGEFEEEILSKVSHVITSSNIDVLITIGEAAKHIYMQAQKKGFNNLHHFDEKEKGIEFLEGFVEKDDVVLIKASRKYQFEDVLKYLIHGNSSQFSGEKG